MVNDANNIYLFDNKQAFGFAHLSDIDVAVHDAVVCALMDSSGFHSEEGGLEEDLWAAESLSSNGDDLTKEGVK